MPKIIRDGAVVEDDWQGALLNPEDFNLADDEGPLAVVLEPDQPPSLIEGDLSRVALVAIHFPVFTDGRCFSYARELRDRGFTGEIRATGAFIRDQLHYLQRCGFNAFQFDEDINLVEALSSLSDFSDAYQAAVDQPQPLFQRRS
jgi:uncharacterized protein (DUF934 family)